MRGKHPAVGRCRHAAGITPAGAGKTCGHKTGHAAHEDHPRRCGENENDGFTLGKIIGSPPQVRGKLLGKLGTLFALRITPAGAGKTQPGKMSQSGQPDHPRRCGENMLPPCRLCVNTGSPPQVRGKLSLFSGIVRITGITPAGAGKTEYRRTCWHLRRDHPRRCGENVYRLVPPCRYRGSPPQVRGKPFYFPFSFIISRITPAGAGKTEETCIEGCHHRDHPRRCGENFRQN